MEENIYKVIIDKEIKRLDNDYKNIKKLIKEKNTFPNYLSDIDRVRLKAYATKTKEIKERLEKVIKNTQNC